MLPTKITEYYGMVQVEAMSSLQISVFYLIWVNCFVGVGRAAMARVYRRSSD